MTKKKKVDAPVYRIPGPLQLASFLQANSKLFNFAELERQCELPAATLRHIIAGSRPMLQREYESLQKVVLPKICEMVFLLQMYNAGNVPNNGYERYREY